jgi:hypothetical protein
MTRPVTESIVPESIGFGTHLSVAGEGRWREDQCTRELPMELRVLAHRICISI